MVVFSMLRPILAAVAFLLFVALVSYASGAEPAQTSADAPSTVAAEACRDCGLPYYRPSAALPEAGSDVQPDTPSASVSNAQPNVEFDRSHLSADPRINTARILIQRNGFAEALEILRRMAPDHPDQTDVRFLLGLSASRGFSGAR